MSTGFLIKYTSIQQFEIAAYYHIFYFTLYK